MTDQRGEPTVESGANSAHSEAENEAVTQDESTLEIMRLAQRGKMVYQERAAALRTELAQVEEQLRRFESLIEVAQGREALSKRKITGQRGSQGKDPIKSARASWAQAMRRKMPKAEIERRKLVYEEALKKGKK